jgi:two-component system phosphate regulon sensor histidine kinase PhoR
MNHLETAVDSSRVKILVVDDHPNTANTLARALAQLGSHVEVLSATSGHEALEHVKDRSADILITDMIMPGMTGLELIEKLQNHPSGRPTFTFLITAYDVPGLNVTARRLKVKEVIVKPVHPERIRQVVLDAMDEMVESKPTGNESNLPQKFKILIADDQPDNVMLLSRYLESEGYSYIKAQDGLETLEKVRSDVPDLVLLDINMPHKDGFEVLKDIRADAAIQHVPVIILTAARIDPTEIQSGLNMGADDYITKPFDRRELLARIRTKLRVKEAEDIIRRRNRELNLLPEIGKELSARLNIDELSNLVLHRTVETMGALVGHIILLNNQSLLHKEYHVASDVSLTDTHIPSVDSLLQQIQETGEGILVTDTKADSGWHASADDPSHSAIVIPMFGRLNIIGYLVLIHEQPNYFKEDHKLLLQAIAGQAAIAVENARLYTDMAQEQQKLNAILQSAADPIIMFDADDSLSMLNPAARGLFTDLETKVGLPLMRGRGYDALLNGLEETYTLGTAHSREIAWPDRRVFNALFTPIAEGGCVLVMHDVTNFKRLEKVKNEFIATASHDLRNPLTSIKGYSQLMQAMGPLNENQVDFVKRIQHGAEHMAELIENMLDLAKMDMGTPLKTEKIDVITTLTDLADEFKPQAQAKNQMLSVIGTDCNFKIQGDALKIRQALRNLIGNAIKYTGEAGTITLSTEHLADQVNIRVADTGYGIPAADLPHMFTRFYRVRNIGHDDIEGNGLGLAIVKSIAEQHGGGVSVESEFGKGSCFTLSLPLALMREA